MGRAFDTIAAFQTTVNSTLAAGVMATGDSATIRNFPDSERCLWFASYYDDVTTPLPWRVRSAMLHDNVQGVRNNQSAAAQTTNFATPYPQPMEAQDQLTVELSTAASTGKALAALGLYYSNLPGIAARLYGRGDISPLVENIKPVFVSIGSGANTAGQWLDTALTTSENLLKANTDYAVLGITLDVAVACLAIKGSDTGNLRCGVPGGTNNPYGPFWFDWASMQTGLPLIPVINAANAGSTYLSLISSAATAAASTATVWLAQLAHNLQ